MNLLGREEEKTNLSKSTDHPFVTVDVLPFTICEDKLKLLLVRRGTEPFYGRWAIPGGFLGMEESARQAAERKLFEETHVEKAHLEQLYTFSCPKRDPRSRVLSIAYLALIPAGHLCFVPGPEILETDLFEIIERGGQLCLLRSSDQATLSGRDLAFDHETIIRTALARMRGKIWYTDIAFSLMSDRSAFTLPELMTAFKAILGTPLDAGNFYRKIKREYLQTGRIEETGEQGKPWGKKKATLYRITWESEPFGSQEPSVPSGAL